MTQFNYLSEKINNAKFSNDPFKHIIINDFFSKEHFNRITSSKQILAKEFQSHREVVYGLEAMGYTPQPFPGCITDTSEYIRFAEGKAKIKRNLIRGYGKSIIEGYGLTMRLKKIEDVFLQELIEYLNGDQFQKALKSKFSINKEVSIETAYQKNLKHYQISPHCDTSRKALTYMINIYNVDDCQTLEMHTHLLKLKPKYNYLYDFWKNTEFDPVWIPWEWCKTTKTTNTNNSISIFKPSHDTLHAVKIDEDHFVHQRNQIYGNLWYDAPQKTKTTNWQSIDLIKDSFNQMSKSQKVKYFLKEIAKEVLS